MAKIINYRNVLDPLNNEVKYAQVSNSKELLGLFTYDPILYDIAITRNQDLMECDFNIEDNDIIAISLIPKGGDGGGAKVLRTVAMVALAVSAPYLTAGLVGFGGFAVSELGFYALQAGVMIAGSLAINAVLPAFTPDLNINNSFDSLNSSPTYSWNPVGNPFEQGKPVPILYGTSRVRPPLVSKYVETIGNKQYLNLLLAINDGECDIDVSTIKINDQALSNFVGIETFIRRGLNEQGVIGSFDDQRTDVGVNIPLNKDAVSYVTRTTQGTNVSGLNAVLLAPSGLYFANDLGGLTQHSVEVRVEFSSDGVNWAEMSSQDAVRINGDDAPTTAFYLSYNRTDASGNRIWRTYATIQDAINDASFNNNLYLAEINENTIDKRFFSLAETVSDDTVYLQIYRSFNTVFVENYRYALIGASNQPKRFNFKAENLPLGQYQIRARYYSTPEDTARYSSNITFEYFQEAIKDDFMFPNTALLGIRALATDQLNGNLPDITVVANNPLVRSNPSLICQDILSRSGVTLSVSELESFNEWETFCDDNDYTCNIYFDEIFTLRKALDLVGTCGRGNPLQFGSKWGVIIDKPNILATQGFLFNMGNIIKDSFKEEFLPLKDRVNTLEVTYYDEELDYTPQMIEVSNANFDSVDNVNKTSLSLIGCTNRDMALRYAKYTLNCSRYLTITQSFDIQDEAIVCKVGDVVRVSHDVPAIGQSGRVVSGTMTSVVLDTDIDLELDTYYLQVRYNDTDEIIETQINESNTTTDTVTFTALAKAPAKYDLFSIGKIDKVSKLMRVVDIRKSSEHKSKISCLEYIDEVYSDTVISIPTTQSDFTLVLSNATEFLEIINDKVDNAISLSWRGSALYYDVLLNGNLYQRTTDTSISIRNILDDSNYDVVVKDSFGNSISTSISTNLLGIPLDEVENLSITESGNLFSLSWDYDFTPINFKEFVIFLNGFAIATTTNTTFEHRSLGLNEKNFTVKVKNSANVLNNGVSFSITAQRPNDVQNFLVENAFDKIKTLTWDTVNIDDIDGYEIRISNGNTRWEECQKLTFIKEPPYNFTYTRNGSFALLIKALDTGGNYSLNATKAVFNVGEDTVSNIVEQIDFHPLWDGEGNNYVVENGILKSITGNNLFYPNTFYYNTDESIFYGNATSEHYNNILFYKDDIEVFYSENTPPLTYIEGFIVSVGGLVKLSFAEIGQTSIYYRTLGSEVFFNDDANAFYENDDNLFFGDFGGWTSYNGNFLINSGIEIQFKIEGDQYIEVSAFSVIVDVPDILEYINDATIDIGGTTIAPTKIFNTIKTVQITLQDVSSEAYVKVNSKSANGANIQVFDSNDNDVGGLIDIQYQGY